MNLARRLLAWTQTNRLEIAQNVAATLALGSVAYGFWLAYEPLGWIIPGVVVFGCLVWWRLRDNRD